MTRRESPTRSKQNRKRKMETGQESCNDHRDLTTLRNMHLRDIATIKRNEDHLRWHAVLKIHEVLSGENPPIDNLLSGGALRILVHCVASDDAAVQFEGALALTNIAARTAQTSQAIVDAGAVPLLVHLLLSKDANVCEQAMWTLGHIIGHGPHLRDYCLKFGLVPLLYNHVKPNVRLNLCDSVAWIIGNLCKSLNPPLPPETIKEILKALALLLGRDDTSILAHSIYAIVDLTAGAKENVQLVMDSEECVVPSLVRNLSHAHVDVQRAAALAVSNVITCGSSDQIRKIVDCGVIRPLCTLLASTVPEVVRVVLGSIYRILLKGGKRKGTIYIQIEECEAMRKIGQLVSDNNVDVSKVATLTVDLYFREYEVDNNSAIWDIDQEIAAERANSLLNDSSTWSSDEEQDSISQDAPNPRRRAP